MQYIALMCVLSSHFLIVDRTEAMNFKKSQSCGFPAEIIPTTKEDPVAIDVKRMAMQYVQNLTIIEILLKL